MSVPSSSPPQTPPPTCTISILTWSLSISLAGILSLVSLYSFTEDARFNEGMGWLIGRNSRGSTRSISEMIIATDPYVQGRAFAGLNVSMIFILVHYFMNVWPVTRDHYSSYPKLEKLLFSSFIISVVSVQNVITITYRQGLWLHFGFAGLFFLFSALTCFTSTYLELRVSKRISLTDRIRLYLNILSSFIMLVAWVLFGLAPLAWQDIERIDQRPPVIWAEILGCVGFLFYCASLLPNLLEYKTQIMVFQTPEEQDNVL